MCDIKAMFGFEGRWEKGKEKEKREDISLVWFQQVWRNHIKQGKKQPRKCKRSRERAPMKRKAKKTRKEAGNLLRADRIQAEAEHIHPFLCHPGYERRGGLWFCNIENICLWQWPENKAKKKNNKSQLQLNRILLKTKDRGNSSGF